MSDVTEPSKRNAVLSGRMVVMLMFAFGALATALLFLYWKLHLMPFMPLQEAIVAEFPGSAPRVDGGQKRMSKGTPVLLRIVMKTQLNPGSTDPDVMKQLDHLRSRIRELSVSKVQLPGLQAIELHLYQLVREKEILERSFRCDVESSVWQEIDSKGQPIESPVVAPTEAMDESGLQRAGP